MSGPSKADRFLLDSIRRGDTTAWSRFIARYQGRLLAFAEARLRGSADAEDVVQDTFLAFLESLDRFRADASLETYLFSILRNKIIDRYRGPDRKTYSLEDSGRPSMPGNVPTASWYVRREEDRMKLTGILIESLRALMNRYKHQDRFEELKIIELLYYRGMRNKDIAVSLDLTEQRVALIKHRTIERLRQTITQQLRNGSWPSAAAIEDTSPASWFESRVLQELWGHYRISCPKRSTIGGYLLSTLDAPWLDYVEFHLNLLGCDSCRANLEDLRRQNERSGHEPLHQRVMQSTVGFLRTR